MTDEYCPAEQEDDEAECALCGKRIRAGDMQIEEVLMYGDRSEMLPVCKECQR